MVDTKPGSIDESSPDAPKPTRRKVVRYVLGVPVFLLVAIQFVPYGRNHANSPVTATPAWDSKATEDLVRRACYDCHSNETRWPWYSHVAPMSWLVQSDVDEGREELNFSIGHLREIDEAAELVREGEMPPWFYLPLHREARLTSSEKDALLRGLEATFGNRPKRSHGEGDESD